MEIVPLSCRTTRVDCKASARSLVLASAGRDLWALVKIKTRVPDDVLVLPAHNSPFLGLHARIDQLIQSHVDGLRRLETMLSEPRRSTDVFSALFARPITPGVLAMATGEAMAHLNHLLGTGRATSTVDDAGVRWWRRP